MNTLDQIENTRVLIWLNEHSSIIIPLLYLLLFIFSVLFVVEAIKIFAPGLCFVDSGLLRNHILTEIGGA